MAKQEIEWIKVLPIMITLFLILGGGLSFFFIASADTAEKITSLRIESMETYAKKSEVKERLQKIEIKLDRVLERLR